MQIRPIEPRARFIIHRSWRNSRVSPRNYETMKSQKLVIERKEKKEEEKKKKGNDRGTREVAYVTQSRGMVRASAGMVLQGREDIACK